MDLIVEAFDQTLLITGFVFVMMLVIEYINVLTSGGWQRHLTRSRWRQYVLAAFLGATPGCLGAFVVVAMYTHGMLSLGAVAAAMIATSGDETFVMLALIPKEALALTGILFATGVASGFLTDLAASRTKSLRPELCESLEVHAFESCQCFPKGRILAQWKSFSPFRTILAVALVLFFIFAAIGQIGPPEWGWARISILFVSTLALFIVATVPDHFLEDHLWNHVARKHIPRVFLWTLGTLLVMQALMEQLNLERLIEENHWAVLGVALLVGLIPESGPHLIFVLLFARGSLPFGILLANSVVQDGHGMLPMLAHSRRTFVVVKLVNLMVGAGIGAVMLSFDI
jgi:hypothetical protein